MFTINQDELQSILGQLDQAIRNHHIWFEGITRNLICSLPYDQRDVKENAYRECQFGQWYYNNSIQSLREHPGFIAIEQEHAQMHQLASQLLKHGENNSSVDLIIYDQFANSVERLRLQITSLQRELQDSLFNLDPLTGAYNRIGMLTRLREQHELVKRKAQQCSIAMMDLDLFKKVNDDYGHKIGDLVLTSVVQYILKHIRSYDTIFRYGGEEFLLCMQQTNIVEAADFINRIREGIETLIIKSDTEPSPRITASFGITILDPDVFVEESIDRADQALYKAKEDGRNRSIVWKETASPS